MTGADAGRRRRLRGWAVEDPALIAQVDAALAALADPTAFARRWPAAKGQEPMVLAVGDGNHSLATAKPIGRSKPTPDRGAASDPSGPLVLGRGLQCPQPRH